MIVIEIGFVPIKNSRRRPVQHFDVYAVTHYNIPPLAYFNIQLSKNNFFQNLNTFQLYHTHMETIPMTIPLKKVFASLAIAIIFVSAAWQPVAACINLYAKNLYGEDVQYGGRGHVLAELNRHQHIDKNVWQQRRETLKAEVANPGAKFETRSDYASMGIYVGDVAHSIEQLEALEKEKPGEGNIASNLGTAYELNGNVDKALEWIKEGIKRNPKDHDGTEWLHVKILEAKLEMAKDSKWLETHSVLGLNFGTEAKPVIPTQDVTDFLGAAKTRHEVEAALIYQIHERIYFVKPPEPIVAELLCDLACLTAASQSLPEAKAIMEFALDYKPVHADLSARRLAWFDANSNISGKTNTALILILFGITVVIASGYWLAKRFNAARIR